MATQHQLSQGIEAFASRLESSRLTALANICVQATRLRREEIGGSFLVEGFGCCVVMTSLGVRLTHSVGQSKRTKMGECWQDDWERMHHGLLMLGWRADNRLTSEDEAMLTPLIEKAISLNDSVRGHVRGQVLFFDVLSAMM